MNPTRSTAKRGIVVLIFFLAGSCVLIPCACFLNVVLAERANQAEAERICSQPPEGFSNSTVAGTWRAMHGDHIFTIREDGKYKQTITEKEKNVVYETDWKPWKISYSEKGLPYLHLEGFEMCAYWDSMDCRTQKTNLTPVMIGDTKDPFTGEYYWYDSCQKKWVDTSGEAVFMVIGASEYFLRRTILVPFTKSSDGTTGPTYTFREVQ